MMSPALRELSVKSTETMGVVSLVTLSVLSMPLSLLAVRSTVLEARLVGSVVSIVTKSAVVDAGPRFPRLSSRRTLRL